MSFTDSNTVQTHLRDHLCGGVTHHTAAGPGFARRNRQISGLGWHYLAPSDLPRQPHHVFVESFVREALIEQKVSEADLVAAHKKRIRGAP